MVIKKPQLVIGINKRLFKTTIKEILGKIVIISNFAIRDFHLSNKEVVIVSLIKTGVRVATTIMVNKMVFPTNNSSNRWKVITRIYLSVTI